MPDARRIGRFEVLDRLGRGGMGAVFRARDPRLNRLVAIKVIRDDAAQEPEFLRRFEREAIAAARLNSPHIVTLHEFGESDGEPFLVMELVDGPSLAELILRREPVGLVDRLRIIEDVCTGLTEAHRAGIIHRDIKPANVLVTPAGRAKIVDFGIARLGDASTAAQPRGTLPYMSPEQVNGRPLDARSDLFSVGAVLYEVLSFRRAFAGEVADVLRKILLDEPTPLGSLVPDLDPQLEAIVGRALKKDPAERFASAEEMRRALESVRGRQEAARAEPAPPIPSVPDAPTVRIPPPATPDAAKPEPPAAGEPEHDLRDSTPAVAGLGPVARPTPPPASPAALVESRDGDQPPAGEAASDEDVDALGLGRWIAGATPWHAKLPLLAAAALLCAWLLVVGLKTGTPAGRVLQLNLQGPTWIGISGDGRHLAIESRYDVFSFDVERDALLKIGDAYAASDEPKGDEIGMAPYPDITPDGAFIAHQLTYRGTLAPATPVSADIFVWSRATGNSEPVNVATYRQYPSGDFMSWGPTISDDGQVVSFASTASDLVTGDANGFSDVFVRNRLQRSTIRVSVDAAGAERRCASDNAQLSGSGRFVAYRSCLEPASSRRGIYLHDLETRRVTRITGPTGLDLCYDVLHPEQGLTALNTDATIVAFGALISTTPTGPEPPCALATYSRTAGAASLVPRADGRPVFLDPGSPIGLSADGRLVAFVSSSATLTSDDANRAQDVFVMDLMDKTIERIPANRAGEADQGGLLVGWAPTGAHLALVSLAEGAAPGVVLRHRASKRGTFLAGRTAAASR